MEEAARDTGSASAHETGLALFVTPSRRARFRESLANDRRRKKLLDQLNHFDDLDARYVADAPGSAVAIAAALRAKGAPETCHVMSGDAELDGRQMPILAAVEAVESGYEGTFLSCLPGKLAYFRSEPPADGVILQRED
jgi:hypothetical protein